MSKYKSSFKLIERTFFNKSSRFIHNNSVKPDNIFNHNFNSKRSRSLWNFITGLGTGIIFGYGLSLWRYNFSERTEEIMKLKQTQSCPMKNKLSLAPVLSSTNPAIVCIRLIKNNIVLSELSGFFVDHTGLAMTIGIDPSQFDNINIKTQDGRTFPANVVEYDTTSGLCLLKAISQTPIYFHNLDLSDKSDSKCRSGDFVISLGVLNSNSLNHFSLGIIRSYMQNESCSDYFLVSEMSGKDNFTAGGPLINMRGKVIGVNKSDPSGVTGNHLAIPIECGRSLLERIKKHDEIGYNQPLTNNQMAFPCEKQDLENEFKLKSLRKDNFFR